MNLRLIVGLGNPGPDYLETRHNAGFLLVDRLINHFSAREERADADHLLWVHETDQFKVFFMKPMTFMNLSGRAIVSFLQKHPVEPHQMLIAYDDVALPLGKIRIRPSGSAGGQKGMRDIIEVLETSEIPRLRIGIDSPLRGERSLPDFVLSPFQDQEVSLLGKVLKCAMEASESWLHHDMKTTMGNFNARSLLEQNDQKLDGGES